MSSTDERLLNLDHPFDDREGPKGDGRNTHKTRKVTATIPKSIDMRIRAIAKAERRSLVVVITRCFEDYLKAEKEETLPYLPLSIYHEDTSKLSHEYDVELVDAMRTRSEFEGRPLSTVITKAIHEYIIRSPDDPVRVEPKLEPSSELESSGGDL